jgi:RAD51-like protein 2
MDFVDRYEEVRSRRHIITFCKEIDQMLGGGVHLGEMIEFCGVPGIGKTQLAMQLCVDVQIPEAYHGVGGEAIYIDTEGSFMVERCLHMAAAVQQHLTMICRHHQRQPQLDALAALLGSGDGATDSQSGSSQADLSGSASIEGHAFLKGIHVMRVHDHTQQLAAVHALPALLAQNPRGK